MVLRSRVPELNLEIQKVAISPIFAWSSGKRGTVAVAVVPGAGRATKAACNRMTVMNGD